jgi:hypothetical protein
VNIYNIMPWYDSKFFYERGSINLKNVLRFDALPTQSFKSDDEKVQKRENENYLQKCPLCCK